MGPNPLTGSSITVVVRVQCPCGTGITNRLLYNTLQCSRAKINTEIVRPQAAVLVLHGT